MGISNDEGHPRVRCVHILSEGVEEKGALGRMAGEEIQSGGTPFRTQGEVQEIGDIGGLVRNWRTITDSLNADV